MGSNAINIDINNMNLLNKFLSAQARKDLTLTNDDLIIGSVENGILVQAFFIHLDGLQAVTHKIIGSFSNGTVKILDMLCAVCSSRTPEVIYHQFNFLPNDAYNFSECYNKSRLGRFTVERNGQNFTIKYPEN